MVHVNIKSVYDVLQEIANQTQNVDLSDYPDELSFCDSGKVGDGWVQLNDYETRFYNSCFAHSKCDDADKWQAYDEILVLIQWVAERKYRNFPPSDDDTSYRYYRLMSMEPEDIVVRDDLPAQLRLSTPGTYLGPSSLHYIHVKIEQKAAGETVWAMDEDLGLHEALLMLETGAYVMDEPDIDKPERVFRRLY